MYKFISVKLLFKYDFAVYKMSIGGWDNQRAKSCPNKSVDDRGRARGTEKNDERKSLLSYTDIYQTSNPCAACCFRIELCQWHTNNRGKHICTRWTIHEHWGARGSTFEQWKYRNGQLNLQNTHREGEGERENNVKHDHEWNIVKCECVFWMRCARMRECVQHSQWNLLDEFIAKSYSTG